MSRTFKLSSGIMLALIIAISAWTYLSLLGNPFEKATAEKKVTTYLIEQQGFKPEEIKHVKGVYSFKSSEAPYGASVTFADEPNEKYEYIIFNNGDIRQYSHSSNTPKHLEAVN